MNDALACIQQVRAQTYRPLEHVMVHDGPNPELRRRVTADWYPEVPLIFQELGRVWSDEFAYSRSAPPYQVAQLLASGPLQMWLADDEEMDPDHIKLLVNLLEETRSDFVYSKAVWYTAPGLQPPMAYIIGTYPPRPDQITNALYRIELLDYGKFETHVGRGTDWHQVGRWMEAGARYAMLDHVTFRHRADQIGGSDVTTEKRKLRGHEPC